MPWGRSGERSATGEGTAKRGRQGRREGDRIGEDAREGGREGQARTGDILSEDGATKGMGWDEMGGGGRQDMGGECFEKEQARASGTVSENGKGYV